tara:strand:+ start:517 stop:756 length:240 start_codon:yes stop_codon:yes gene_type:complete
MINDKKTELIITEININNEGVINLSPSITLYSIRELQDYIINFFDGGKTYLTKESNSNESMIKCVSDETKFLHLLEINN